MAKQKPEDIINIVFSSHSGSGKTTLVDEILHTAGANNRIGSVKDGSSLSDTAEDEIDGQASIDLGMLYCNYNEKLVHLFDTPGRSDFLASYIAALRVCENVLIPVDVYSGVQVNTRRAWKMAKALGKAVGFVITKLDVENTDLDKTLNDIRSIFGNQCVPFFLPDTTGAGVSKLHSVLNPGDDATDQVRNFHEPLIESIVEADEELMKRYLHDDNHPTEITQHIGAAIESGAVVPILCYAQKNSLGVTEILDTLSNYFPSAATVKSVPVVKTVTDEEGEESTEIVETELDGNTFVAQVFKTVIDEHKGRMAVMRVFSGSSVAGATFHSARTGRSAKFGKLFKFFGAKQEEIDSMSAGDIIAAGKIDELLTGDTVTDGTWTDPVKPIDFPNPMVAFAITPKTRSDESRISQVIQRNALEDPTFRMEMDKQTKEMVVYGLSELHLNVLLARMARKNNVHVDTKLPKISYRETISKPVSDFYRHKKQSGGSGEFAEVHLRMKPYREGEGDFNFVNALHGDAIRRQFVPSVEKGCKSIMEDGILTGSPVIQIQVEFFDGKDHPVDGKDTAFQKAARDCFKKCFLQAGPTLLEPIVDLEVTFPSDCAGDISQYLNSHRGRIQGMEQSGEEQTMRAAIPLSEVQTFSSDLRSMTQGQGNYTMDFAGYDQVPANIQAQVIEQHERERAED